MNIELLTLSEVVDVQGREGNFTVTIKKHPRYVDMDKCIACGVCAEKCPKKVNDAFNMGLNKRKAAYILYGQTVPLKYALDPEHCIYLTKGKCRACEKFCPTGAINFEDRPEEIRVQVGSMILAPGFTPFDPTGLDIYGYDTNPDVVTSLEYERLLSSSGPCMGHLERPSDHSEPAKIAWIQCVGSRNTNRCANGYCSSVCCMYAIKQAQVTAEHLPGGQSPELTIFSMDIRTHGKEFERYAQEAAAKGIGFVRSRPHTVLPGPNNQGAVLHYVTEDGRVTEEHFDLVVLSVGLESSKEARKLADVVGFDVDAYGFAATPELAPASTSIPGVLAAGAFASPMAIPRSVTQASTAATEAAKTLLPAKDTMTKEKTYPQERDISGREPKIGVFVCSCGINIAGVIDVQAVADYARTLPDVALVENNLFTCSTDTQELISQKIAEHGLNRIVIAACTPRTHEPLFQDTLKEAGLNAYMVEMANIRNHNAWVHQKEPDKATAKAKDQVRMAVAKVRRNRPLNEPEVKVTQKALVIGGGVAGMTAALEFAEQGRPVVLLEKSDRLGGNALHLYHAEKTEDGSSWVQSLINEVQAHAGICVLTEAALLSASGSIGEFESRVQVAGQEQTIEYGVAVVATGAREHTPESYLYGQDSRVMTHLEFDTFMRQEPKQAFGADGVTFIQCVGSRTPERMYCSRICCTHTMRSAISLKEQNPQMQVTVLYRDIRTYGRHEDLYTEARRLGVTFIRFEPENAPQVEAGRQNLQIQVQDPILQREVCISSSYLVLASAVEPAYNDQLVELYKCGLNQDGFINEAHPKLRPVDMTVDGLFVAGLCTYPKTMGETIAQAKAAVSRAGAILSKSVMRLDAVKSCVTENCDGCALCVDVCPYQAISLPSVDRREGAEHTQIIVDEALCKGCGLCEATCPKDGVIVRGFTVDQLRSQVDAALAG